MLPFLEKEIVGKKLASQEELLNDYAVAQMTPGIIAVNISTFIGVKIAGFWGALFALMGVITPSVVIISLLSFGLMPLLKSSEAIHMIDGILMGVLALLTPIVYQMIKKHLNEKKTIFIACVALLLRLGINLSAVWVLFISVLLGLLFYGRSK